MIKLTTFILALAAFQLVGCGGGTAAPNTKAPAKKETEAKSTKTSAKQVASQEPAEVPERKSVFEDMTRPPYTDPFFPNTRRRLYVQHVSSTAAPVDQPTVVLDQIVLKGISGPVGRRLALINNYTFAAGESGVVRLPKGSANIEVLEVKERSAVIKVEKDPQPKEIFLRPEP